MAIATAFAAISIYVPLKLFDQLVFDTTRTLNLLLLTGTVTLIGLSVYAFMAWFLNIKEVLTFYNLLRRVIKVKDLVLEPSHEVIHDEEALLYQEFGTDWEAYSRRSWRLIPFVY